MEVEPNVETEFSKRMAAVFGALGSSSGLAQGWRVSEASVCVAGKGKGLQSEADHDVEDDADVVDCVENRAGGEALGDEEGDILFRRSASLAFCSALDRETEMDNFDSMAAESLTAADDRDSEERPPPSTEVLPDNFYEKKCLRRAGGEPEIRLADSGEGAADGDRFLLSEGERCRVAADEGIAPRRGGEPIRWRPSAGDPEADTGATHSGLGDTIPWTAEACDRRPRAAGNGAPEAAPAGGGAEPKRPRGGAPLQWAPGEGSAAAPEGGAAKKRVRFADTQPEGGHGGSTTKHRAALRRGALRPPRHRGPSRVPDHVLHPERWTCYTLDEPITVGSGGGGDTTLGWQSGPTASATGDDETPLHAAAAPCEDDGGAVDAHPACPPLTGIKFVPRGERAKPPGERASRPGEGGGGEPTKAPATANMSSTVLAADDMETDEPPEDGAGANPGIKSGGPRRRNRQFRSKHEADLG